MADDGIGDNGDGGAQGPPYPMGDLEPGKAGVDWFWVPLAAIAGDRQKTLLIDFGGYTFMPAFASREAAESALAALSLSGAGQGDYQAQAMHEKDIRRLAETKGFRVHTVSAEGRMAGDWGVGPGDPPEGPGRV
ncbi:MAG: hypothetical protein LBF40_08000 [Deltaproteobacteria bacterium]|jgi:hypothetical protein|nr:hypothetical protein [Deltaproteobacteria bacterium]